MWTEKRVCTQETRREVSHPQRKRWLPAPVSPQHNAKSQVHAPERQSSAITWLLWSVHHNADSDSVGLCVAPHSSTLAWKIPWTEGPGRLQSMGSLRVGHHWATSLWLFTFMHWRRKWQPTPVFLPGESQGRGSLVGCCLWGRTKSDTTEAT